VRGTGTFLQTLIVAQFVKKFPPSCYASLLPLCCGVNVPTRCSLMVGGIDMYRLFNVTVLDICSREAQLIFSNK
jgi:hypothetical protein